MTNPTHTRNAHYSRSSKYQHINTAAVIEILAAEGFIPDGPASIAGVRDESREGFQKHLTVLKPTFDIPMGKGRGARILLQNAHDGSSSFRLYAGILEFACANGLVLGDFSTEVRIRHTGFTADKVRAGLKEVVSSFETQKQIVDQMKAYTPTEAQMRTIAADVAQNRINKRKDATDYKLTLDTVLQANRPEDTGSDLWTRFNVIQENIIRGGVAYKYKTRVPFIRWDGTASERTRFHNRTTKEVKAFDQQRSLNKMVFEKCYSLITQAA